ncbi:hypothetical protein CRG98_002821 [Punica granatum]|uniref:Carbohydrate kinase PfkB domain-containing protein n=1 Tax=Punica granatum TaxID=22663 RepID=A0A2I0L819_PUNGR|nr:hypothetical protein CRG98_002821 [Punica granatum]
MQGGGDAANTLTCAARLGLNPRLISKIADDMPGSSILRELEADGVDTSVLVKTNTRTCIFTPGHPPLKPDDLSPSSLEDAMRGASVVYFDGRLPYTAAFVAQEAARRNIRILLDAEKKREGLDDILVLACYAVCAAKFPQAWTEAPTIGSALVSMLLRLPKLKFVIVTLGAMGCIMLERIDIEQPPTEEVDVDCLLRSLEQRRESTVTTPICITSVSVLKCHLKKCCHSLQKWRLLAAELSEPELVCHIEQIRASPRSCKMGVCITRLNALLTFLIEESLLVKFVQHLLYDAACPQKPHAIVP